MEERVCYCPACFGETEHEMWFGTDALDCLPGLEWPELFAADWSLQFGRCGECGRASFVAFYRGTVSGEFGNMFYEPYRGE